MCSTPEGIGAGITRCADRLRLATCCAQRPKASERGSPPLGPLRCGGQAVLNARRHRSGDHWRCPRGTPSGSGSAQRPKASERGSRPATREGVGRISVLNARRHRSGDHRTETALLTGTATCSTPEGIGAGITGCLPCKPRCTRCAQRPKASERGSRRARWRGRGGGGGAQRPKASERGSPARLPSTRPVLWGAQRPKASERGSPWTGATLPSSAQVLNARRHRSGDHQGSVTSCDGSASVLNARRHRSGDHRIGLP